MTEKYEVVKFVDEELEDKVFDKELKLNKIFYNGQFYDSYTLIQLL